MDIILKIVSESLLSFYPAMVKYINFPIINQLWARVTVYSLIAFFFMNKKIGFQLIFSSIGLLLAFVSVIHIWTSYLGFKNLDAGVSYSIFYIYPLLIILFSGNPFSIKYIIPLIGVGLLTYSGWINNEKNNNFVLGISGIIGATLTEVWLYFIVKKMNITNKWNILFISYLLPTIIFTLVLNKNIIPQKNDDKWKKNVILMLLGNAIIGALGYYLRYYTISRLPSRIYGVLSYFGIVMAYVYGWFLNKEKLSWVKAIGSGIILISSLFFY